MSYTKTNWKNGDVISEQGLNNIESGIANIDTVVTEINTKVTAIAEDLKTLGESVKTNVATVAQIGEELKTLGSTVTGNTEKVTKVTEDLSTLGESVKTNSDMVTKVTSSLDGLAKSITQLNASIVGMPARMTEVEAAIAELKKNNVVPVPDVNQGFNDESADAVVEKVAINAGKTSISAKSIALKGTTAESAHTALTAKESVALTGVKTTGTLERKVSNAAWSVNTDDVVTIRDCDFGQTGYNCVEIGLTKTAPRLVTIDNCKFGDASNNSILVFATQNNAVINVTNCKFGSISDMIRLSNRTNATGVVVNIVNCEITALDANKQWPLIICQDYMAGTGEQIKAANRFGPEKITINIINTKVGGKLITLPEDMSVMGTGKEGNLCTVWNNYENSTSESTAAEAFVPYGDGSRYPKINVA